jgi:hypothetical protein
MNCTRDNLILQQGYVSVNWLVRCEFYMRAMPVAPSLLGLSRIIDSGFKPLL